MTPSFLPPPPPPSDPPSWPFCGHGADTTTDPVGCRGIHVPGHTACLAHITEAQRTTYFATLTPGADIDHRGTPIAQPLLDNLLRALHDPVTGTPRIGTARFDRAQFTGRAKFDGAQFSGFAGFVEAQFTGFAQFEKAQFMSLAGFAGAQFTGGAMFKDAQFSDRALFAWAQFSGRAVLDGAQFSGRAEFDGAQFVGSAEFDAVQFSSDAQFSGAQFIAVFVWGSVVCAGRVDLSGAVFAVPVTIRVAARELVCVRARWESTATLRVRYADVDLTDAVLSAPLAVTAHPAPFTTDTGTGVDERLLAGASRTARVVSAQGVDAAHLVLTDTDLSECLFTGAFHLDQLRLEGRTAFAPVPEGIHRRYLMWPIRWSQRRTLAEEHHWRAQAASHPIPVSGQTASARRWRTGLHHGHAVHTPDPEDVAAVYRQLRKAFEDGKNEPGAADFYYGEMEMRRHDRTGTPRAERGLLHGYWLFSGYGLRSSRAMAWLLAAMSITVLLLMLFGLPTHDPDPTTLGTLTGDRIALATSTPDSALTGSLHQRLTAHRAEKAIRVAVNSVVFRSSGQNLTTAGTYIEMASRFLEPTFLALAVLAVRGRIKR